jgi:hypothetical protein
MLLDFFGQMDLQLMDMAQMVGLYIYHNKQIQPIAMDIAFN